jgi:hypothetical protein
MLRNLAGRRTGYEIRRSHPSYFIWSVIWVHFFTKVFPKMGALLQQWCISTAVVIAARFRAKEVGKQEVMPRDP